MRQKIKQTFKFLTYTLFLNVHFGRCHKKNRQLSVLNSIIYSPDFGSCPDNRRHCKHPKVPAI